MFLFFFSIFLFATLFFFSTLHSARLFGPMDPNMRHQKEKENVI